MMLTFGVDAHKQIHMVVVLNGTGSIQGTWCGPNSHAGWEEMLQWACSLAEERQWGIEGAWNYGRGLAQYLVDAGETVFDINPRWTAERRHSARKVDKSDTRDAHAIAKIVQQEQEVLSPVQAEDESAILDLLVTEREDTIAEATRLRNQLHQLLLQLDPDYKQHLPTLTSKAGVRALLEYTTTSAHVLDRHRAAAVRRLAQRLDLATQQASALAGEIRTRAQRHYAPLAELPGLGLLAAGALAGILGPGQRFESDAQLAALAGIAPLEASSAGHVRHRLNRGGNRRLNAVVHRMAQTQARCYAPAKVYLERRQTEGKTRREAIRALKRHLIRAIWHRWKECQPTSQQDERSELKPKLLQASSPPASRQVKAA
jgi:transposase